MKTLCRDEPPLRVESMRGFSVWRGAVQAMRGSHFHADIELNLVLRGEVECFLAGRFHTLPEGTLAAFWAGVPHTVPRVAPGTEVAWAVVPLASFLEWRLLPAFADDLLRGHLVRAPHGENFRGAEALQRAQFLRWCDEAQFPASREAADGAAQKIIALEIEACLRRLAQHHVGRSDKNAARVLARGNGRSVDAQVEKLAAFIGAHYREDIDVDDIARAANLNSNYAMTLFRQQCGLSLWEYVLRLRVSHAQHLLLFSGRKMEDVAHAAGFGSAGRFYAAFARYAGTSPRAWRRDNT